VRAPIKNIPPPTPDQFAAMMKEIISKNGPELRHQLADELLCRTLRLLGYGLGVKYFHKMPKWHSRGYKNEE